MAIISVGGVALPAPVSLSIADQIIWSAATGRSADGTMVGDVVAEKKTLEISWGILTESQYLLIKRNLTSGFFSISFRDDGIDMTISSYRSDLKRDVLGWLGGVYYYRSVSVSIVQQ